MHQAWERQYAPTVKLRRVYLTLGCSLLLGCFGLRVAAQAPARIPTGCERNAVLAEQANHTYVPCTSAPDPDKKQELALLRRLTELAKKTEESQRSVENFVRRINDAGVLVQSRNGSILRNVATFVQNNGQASDSELLENMNSLADQLEQLEARLDALKRDPATASKVRAALSGEVGDALVNLQPVKASDELEAIARLDKKIDVLSEKIDCSSATPEALRLAIRARVAERTINILHCRPENVVSPDVQTAFVLLFTNEEFRDGKPFLDQLIASGYNPLKEIKPLNGRMPSGVSNEGAWLAAGYFYEPVFRPLMAGNLEALKWLIANAPPGYWSRYKNLMEQATTIMDLPSSRVSGSTAVRVISMLRIAGVPIDNHDYKAFKDAYKRWLELELPPELQTPLDPPNALDRMMAGQYGYSLSPHTTLNGEVELWNTVSEALAPTDQNILKGLKASAVSEMTEGGLEACERKVKELTNQLDHRTWFRKLPETNANLQEAARRQAISPFDSFGYVPVRSGDVQDADVLPGAGFSREPTGYPNCNCWIAKDLRDQLARAMHRRDTLVQFRSEYSK